MLHEIILDMKPSKKNESFALHALLSGDAFFGGSVVMPAEIGIIGGGTSGLLADGSLIEGTNIGMGLGAIIPFSLRITRAMSVSCVDMIDSLEGSNRSIRLLMELPIVSALGKSM